MTTARTSGTAAIARQRLLGDKAVRPAAERRARLDTLAERLDFAARRVMTEQLAARVRTNRDFAPVLGSLMRMSLNA